MATPELLAETLRATLSSDPNIRIAAELKLSHDLTNPDSALALCQLVLIQSIDHSASIVLRKYVNEHWSPYFQSFKGAAPPFEAKGQMRQAIFQGLSDSERKIRSLSAVTLSHIAHCDWPDEYPDLLTNLLQLLSSGSPDSIHGAMQVFTEFIKSDLTEDQILPILRDLLPVLLNILGSTDHTPLTRSRTISVFRQCAEALFMVKEQHPQAVREATASVLPVWLEAFKVLLSIDPSQDFSAPTWDSLHVRIQVFKALDTLYSAFPKALIPYLPDLLTASLDHLQKLYVPFAKYYLSADAGSAPGTSEDESVDLSQLACPIFDFVGRIVRHGKAGAWLDDSNTTLLVSAVFKIAQMTTDDEETWASNVNAFTAQEGDDSVYGTRVAAFDLLTSLIDRNPVQIATTFQTIIQQVVSTSMQARDNGDQDWWRLLEAALAAIGSQAPPLLDCIDSELDDGRKPIDIEYLLANVIPSVLQLPEFPFLQGRAFVFASEYAQLLPLQLAGQYLEAAIHVLEAPESSIPVKVSAVKAVKKFCQAADDKNLQPYVERITKDLGPFLLVTSEELLSLVLDTLSVVIKVSSGSWISHDLASSLVIALLDVWSKNSKDPIFVGMFSDILQILASSSAPDVYPTVVKQALPTLCSAIANAKPSESYIASTGIDLVRSVLGGSPESGLGDGFFAMLAPVLFKTLAEAEDRDILQNGVGCLTLVVRKDCSQLLAWNDGNGRSGLDHVLVVIAKLLQSEGESGGLEIGDLIIHLLRNTGDAIAPVLPELLQAMLGRMRTAKTATFLQASISLS
ncbi:hypothetical protein ONZ45_g11445 [Pleurotus djamor]|nr:hypothetical protein ONZ45_g11445 [Pleurotus djamor]